MVGESSDRLIRSYYLSAQLHSEIAAAAAKTGKSLNQWVVDELEKAAHAL
jgi:predicted HicB family RNase H-like nuclease